MEQFSQTPTLLTPPESAVVKVVGAPELLVAPEVGQLTAETALAVGGVVGVALGIAFGIAAIVKGGEGDMGMAMVGIIAGLAMLSTGIGLATLKK